MQLGARPQNLVPVFYPLSTLCEAKAGPWKSWRIVLLADFGNHQELDTKGQTRMAEHCMDSLEDTAEAADTLVSLCFLEVNLAERQKNEAFRQLYNVIFFSQKSFRSFLWIIR